MNMSEKIAYYTGKPEFIKKLFMDMESHKPMSRWWIPAAYVDWKEIEREIIEMSQAGFKGLEISVLMSETEFNDEEARIYTWGTPRWKELFKFILKTANRNGMRIDTTISPAWPCGVPTIKASDPVSSKEILICPSEVFESDYSGELPVVPENTMEGYVPKPPEPEHTDNLGVYDFKGIGEDKDLLAVLAVKTAEYRYITKTQSISWGEGKPGFKEKTKKTVLIDGQATILLDKQHVIQKEGRYYLSWKAPEPGQWKLFAVWMRGTGQISGVGRPTYDPCVVVDHFSIEGVKVLMDFWDKHILDDEVRNLLKENGGAIFEDSLELAVTRHGILWTPGMLEEFKRRKNYDLTPYLPLLCGLNHRGDSNVDFFAYELKEDGIRNCFDNTRIRNDFMQVITDLYLENHLLPLQEWATGLGLNYRAQCYSGVLDTVYASSLVSQPEGESIGFGEGVVADDRFRLVGGGAHMGLRKQISDEVGALVNKGYRMTWQDMLEVINKGYLGGANLMVFHGSPYRDSNRSRWPGYSPFGFMIAGSWTSRQPFWKHINDFTGYLSRVQSVLGEGKPRVDVAVLKIIYGTSGPFFRNQDMARCGYSYDFITHNILKLPTARVENGILCPEGPGYRALVLDNQEEMPAETIENLIEFAGKGLPVVVCGKWPHFGSYTDPDYPDTKICELSIELLSMENVTKVKKQSEVPAALMEACVPPAAAFEKKSEVFATHRFIDGSDFYHLFNHGTADINMNIDFMGTGRAFEIDLWSGETTEIVSSEKDGVSNIDVSLISKEAKMFAFEGDNGDIKKSLKKKPLGFAIVLSHGWRLKVERWQDAGNDIKTYLTEKTELDIGKTELIPWSKHPSLSEGVSGIGEYTNEFTLDSKWEGADGAVLTIKSAHYASIRLWINNESVPLNQYSLTADIKKGILKQGVNIIKLELTTTLGNQLIVDDRIKPAPFMPGAPPHEPYEIEIEDFGLLGPVRIEPYDF